MVLKIGFNNLLKMAAHFPKKKFAVTIVQDPRICEDFFKPGMCGGDVNFLKRWQKHFQADPNYYISTAFQNNKNKPNLLTLSGKYHNTSFNSNQYAFNFIPVICDFYTMSPYHGTCVKEYTICEHVYSKCEGNWEINLVLKKIYTNKKTKKQTNK